MRVYVILEFTDADLVTPALNLTLTSGENLVREIARADSLADLVNAVEEHAVIAELSETKAAAFRYGTPDLVAVPARSRLRAFRDDKPPLAMFDPEDAVEGMRAQLAPPDAPDDDNTQPDATVDGDDDADDTDLFGAPDREGE
jgi:hypothetical protein